MGVKKANPASVLLVWVRGDDGCGGTYKREFGTSGVFYLSGWLNFGECHPVVVPRSGNTELPNLYESYVVYRIDTIEILQLVSSPV
jgi:hypothetical protein